METEEDIVADPDLKQRTFEDDDDFCMVLPSNSSPNTHPNNIASDFIVNWENPFQLHHSDKWSVALTELNYMFPSLTLSQNHKIEYKKYDHYTKEIVSALNIHHFPNKLDFKGHASDEFSLYARNISEEDKKTLMFDIFIDQKEGCLTITSSVHPFQISHSTNDQLIANLEVYREQFAEK